MQLRLKQLVLAGLLLAAVGCASPKEPVFRRVDDFKINRNEESRKLQYQFSVVLFNPNRYPIKILDYEVDVYLNGKLMGTALAPQKYKLIRESESAVGVEIQTDLWKSVKTLFGMATNLFGGKEMSVKLEGRIKGKVRGVSKWIPIREEFPFKMPT